MRLAPACVWGGARGLEAFAQHYAFEVTVSAKKEKTIASCSRCRSAPSPTAATERKSRLDA